MSSSTRLGQGSAAMVSHQHPPGLALPRVSINPLGSLPCSALPALSQAQVWERRVTSYTGGHPAHCQVPVQCSSALHAALSSSREKSPAWRSHYSQVKKWSPTLDFMSHPQKTPALLHHRSPQPACLPWKPLILRPSTSYEMEKQQGS